MAIRHRVHMPVEQDPNAQLFTFDLGPTEKGHTAMVFSQAVSGRERLVRVHSECVTGDVFGSLRCDCGPQRISSFNRCAAEGGIFIYLRQEGRGLGLEAKIETYSIQDQEGLDTFAANRAIGRGADERSYAVAAHMLKDLGVTVIRLMTNNPDKLMQLKRNGIEITGIVPTQIHITPQNAAYMEAKRKSGHILPAPSADFTGG